jgi:hypothetical protein
LDRRRQPKIPRSLLFHRVLPKSRQMGDGVGAADAIDGFIAMLRSAPG